MSPKIFFAPRFRGSAFAAELRARLADARDETAPSPIVLVGMPRLATFLAPILRDRLTLILDGGEQISDKLAKRLAKLRIASFSFACYSRLRLLGADAACFDWAPITGNGQALDPHAYVADGLQPGQRSALEKALRTLSKPRWLAALLGLYTRAADVVDTGERISDSAVYVAPSPGGGLHGEVLDAMMMANVVFAPDTAFFRQYITNGVSGLLCGRAYSPPPEIAPAIAAMAARSILSARRRCDDDRERFGDFVARKPIARRTSAQIIWPPAPACADAPLNAKEGGARTRGARRTDAPDTPLVTVAIVVRNARESFAPTLASVLAQDYPNREIIVVDGDSTDGTREEIAARDHLLDYWISARDSGPYDGMNKAASLASGRFLIFMNAGDYFPNVSAITQAFEAPGMLDADIVIGHHIYVDPAGVERFQKAACFDESWRNLCAGDVSWEWLEGIPCGQAVFIRSQLLRDHPFDTTYRICADHAFLYEAKRRGHRFAHCDNIIGVYTSGGLSGSDHTKTSRELLRLARNYGPRNKIDAWFSANQPYGFFP